MTSRVSAARKFDECLHFFLALKLTMGLIIRYVLLNIIDKISLNPTASPRLQPRTVFGFLAIIPYSPRRNKQFCSLRRSIVLSFRDTILKQSSQGIEPRIVFGFVTFVSVISSSKQTTLFLAPLFYRAYLPSYRNHLHRELSPGRFLSCLHKTNYEF
jgi:hypothetical protein